MPTHRPRYSEAPRSRSSMSWRAAGAQFYPGGAYDALREISHRGKGPKGYRPSDARLAEIVCERLTDDPFVDARNISVAVNDGEVTLTGSVEERRQKYIAEDVVADFFADEAPHLLVVLVPVAVSVSVGLVDEFPDDPDQLALEGVGLPGARHEFVPQTLMLLLPRIRLPLGERPHLAWDI